MMITHRSRFMDMSCFHLRVTACARDGFATYLHQSFRKGPVGQNRELSLTPDVPAQLLTSTGGIAAAQTGLSPPALGGEEGSIAHIGKNKRDGVERTHRQGAIRSDERENMKKEAEK